jgi:hypothetical protein
MGRRGRLGARGNGEGGLLRKKENGEGRVVWEEVSEGEW